MIIKVRNKVTGKVYECKEEDYRRAKRKGAALVKIGEVKPEVPSFLKEEEIVEPPKPKRKSRRKAESKNNQKNE